MGGRSLPCAVAVGASLVVAACSALPAAGPLNQEVVHSQAGNGGSASAVDYVVVDLTAAVTKVLSKFGGPSLAGSFSTRGDRPLVTIGVGDAVEVTIFESSPGGLFTPPGTAISGGNFVRLPAQVVDRSGTISVPYAGEIPAAGRTPVQVQQAIEERLRNRAIEPQAVVAITDRKSNLVTVAGEVGQPGRVVIPPSGLRIVDAIAQAGGPKFPAYETNVTLQRDSQKATASLAKLLVSPQDNIRTVSNDTIFVSRQQQTFLAFGASGKNGQIAFETDRLSLAESVAKAGGLLDERADPAGVFLYRIEDRKTLESAGFDLKNWSGQWIPTIYRVNLRDPGILFLTRDVPMRDKDIVYISNAPAVEFDKFLTIVKSVTSIARDIHPIAVRCVNTNC
jgi:polysaccharide biosynthesis/export protein